MIKKTKWVLVTTCGKIRIDEDEIPSILSAISTGTVKMLRQGVFNPPMFGTIIPDDETMKEFFEDKKYDIRDGKITEMPAYTDLFKEVRQKFQAIGGGQSKQIGG